MTKLPRTAEAFARRALIGNKNLWIIVEGRICDRAFADRLAAASTATNGKRYSIRLIEQFSVDGTVASGKQASLSLYRRLKALGALHQEQAEFSVSIGFLLDRDWDHITGVAIADSHLIYTNSADAEADILANGDLVGATSAAYSITLGQARKVLPSGADTAGHLASNWQAWITLAIMATRYGASSAGQFAKISQINADSGFGPLDNARHQALRAQVLAATSPPLTGEQFDVLKADIDELFAQGSASALVKGKWIEKYIHHVVTANASLGPVEAGIRDNTLTKSCLLSLDTSALWFQHYERALSAICF